MSLVVDWRGRGVGGGGAGRSWLYWRFPFSLECALVMQRAAKKQSCPPNAKAAWELPTNSSTSDIPKGLCKEASYPYFPKGMYLKKREKERD